MRYAFEDCVLDAARRAGEVARLEPKVYHVLAYLVQHAERLVMQRELLKHGWPDVIVEPIAVACSSRTFARRWGAIPKSSAREYGGAVSVGVACRHAVGMSAYGVSA